MQSFIFNMQVPLCDLQFKIAGEECIAQEFGKQSVWLQQDQKQ